MRLGLLSSLSFLLLAGCGADSANDIDESGPASCAAINDACEDVQPDNTASDPLFQCQLVAHGDDETECAKLNEQLNCLDRCDEAQ